MKQMNYTQPDTGAVYSASVWQHQLQIDETAQEITCTWYCFANATAQSSQLEPVDTHVYSVNSSGSSSQTADGSVISSTNTWSTVMGATAASTTTPGTALTAIANVISASGFIDTFFLTATNI